MRTAPSRIRTVTSGKEATRADRTSESATGSSCWTNTRTSPDSVLRKRSLTGGGRVVSATRQRQCSVPENFFRYGEVTGTEEAGGVSGVRGAQHPEVPPARDLHRVRRSRSPAALLPVLRPGRLAHGVGERFEIVTAGTGGGRGVGEPDDLPAARRGEPLTVLGAQVVAVGLGIGGERAEDRGRVGIDVRQCRDGGTAARGSRTATYRAHDVGRYRTLERAATTLPQLTSSCRPVDRARRGSGAAAPTCGAAGARDGARSPGANTSGRSAARPRSRQGPEPLSDLAGMFISGHPAGLRRSRDRPGPGRVTLRR